ncbi:MAG: OmpA family protein [Candidatus Omnitrophica bacterium]|nr:OmpA family protein [Candidatus Omnitrophota bacterium]MDD5042140.1 OmpA family protein [Candidatus Omnitrophota bacterium]MDD5500169.1 OmpA family protein [Candidatus Omnitrophota bacterium]
MKNGFLKFALVLFLTMGLAGCSFVFQKGRRSDAQKIEELNAQLDELMRSKNMLEDKLGKEISDKQIKLQMMEKGLVITVVGDLLFDSGKSKIRPEAYPLLDKVSEVLKDNMAQFDVGIEGHTDNVPIKLSGWKSNWELSTARALSVLHYLVKDQGISPERLSAIGYGEYRPVASNDTAEGRKQNRRVEIVILPNVTKVRENAGAHPDTVVKDTAGDAASSLELREPEENLK